MAYRIMTRNDWYKFMLKNAKASSDLFSEDNLIKMWNSKSKGYEFVIAIGSETEPMIYSVDYFNNKLISWKGECI
ncbi:hypothetical protein [Terrisporobacter sp.]|uniref:hypothetical protein n=1 Tax=Terrisporobacter sp. TaxID=1965305 RepID=UPI00289FB139|nr:hypothetical protein [Terrisporobacter sp.]